MYLLIHWLSLHNLLILLSCVIFTCLLYLHTYSLLYFTFHLSTFLTCLTVYYHTYLHFLTYFTYLTTLLTSLSLVSSLTCLSYFTYFSYLLMHLLTHLLPQLHTFSHTRSVTLLTLLPHSHAHLFDITLYITCIYIICTCWLTVCPWCQMYVIVSVYLSPNQDGCSFSCTLNRKKAMYLFCFYLRN